MKNISEVKEITQEIAEMLQGADEKQKILIKGILIGANTREKPTLNDMRVEHGLKPIRDGNVAITKA